jgi:hypothetical protein
VPRSVDLLFFGGGDGGVAGDVSHFTLRLRYSTFSVHLTSCFSFWLFFILVFLLIATFVLII